MNLKKYIKKRFQDCELLYKLSGSSESHFFELRSKVSIVSLALLDAPAWNEVDARVA